MQLSDILRPDAVRVVGQVASKKRLLQELSEAISPALSVPPVAILEALVERESLGATGVGGGVALPHARIDGIDRVHGAFIRLEKAVDYDSVDRIPVDLVFGLFAPRDAGVEHLRALALVSRTLRDAGLCSKLRANNDVTAIHSILTEATPSKAA